MLELLRYFKLITIDIDRSYIINLPYTCGQAFKSYGSVKCRIAGYQVYTGGGARAGNTDFGMGVPKGGRRVKWAYSCKKNNCWFI